MYLEKAHLFLMQFHAFLLYPYCMLNSNPAAQFSCGTAPFKYMYLKKSRWEFEMNIVQNNKVVQVFDCGDIEISLLSTIGRINETSVYWFL